MDEFSLITRLLAEFAGTAILIVIGNGAVANVHLTGTKGYNSGWAVIAMGYGIGVMVPVLMFEGVSGSQINPAVTLGLATSGLFPWSEVAPYIAAQLLGAIVGQLCVVAVHKPYYDRTTLPEDVLATFSTINSARSRLNGFANELVGTFLLAFCALSILHSAGFEGLPGGAGIGVGFLVWGLVVGLGGATGPALNPARDLGPRIVHALLPLRHKGGSDWRYAWVPVAAPVVGGVAGVAGWNALLG